MRHIRPFACLLALLSVAACGGRGQQAEAPPDLILHNGRIFTANATQPHAQALAIRGERILAVGSDMEILALAVEATQRIDLQGHPVIPGINDAHEHLTIWPAAPCGPIRPMNGTFACPCFRSWNVSGPTTSGSAATTKCRSALSSPMK